MAILTFDMGEGLLETFGASGKTLEYAMLFGDGHGWLNKQDAGEKILRIRDVKKEEAEPLCKFLLEGLVLSEFKSRMAPEDWDRLLDALPEPDGIEVY